MASCNASSPAVLVRKRHVLAVCHVEELVTECVVESIQPNVLHRFIHVSALAMIIWIRVFGIRWVPDLIGSDMGTTFYSWVALVSDLN
jgi:hypothetical protein